MKRIATAAAVVGLVACGTPKEPIESVSEAKLAVHEASTNADTAQAAPLELQLAREKLDRAEKELHDGHEAKARRLADEAQVDALLADAKAETDESRANAQALEQSIESLRSETSHEVSP